MHIRDTGSTTAEVSEPPVQRKYRHFFYVAVHGEQLLPSLLIPLRCRAYHSFGLEAITAIMRRFAQFVKPYAFTYSGITYAACLRTTPPCSGRSHRPNH